MKSLVFVLCLFLASHAVAQTPSSFDQIQPNFKASSSTIESAFSPDGGAQELILRVIERSQSTLRVAAYSFTSPVIVRALIKAKRRGVDVNVMVDEKGNRQKANIAALNLLVNAGVPVRTVSDYAIHHDKYIVVDGLHVQTGSFNYSNAAARSNSENVLVVWNQRALSATYEQHWRSRWIKAARYTSSY